MHTHMHICIYSILCSMSGYIMCVSGPRFHYFFICAPRRGAARRGPRARRRRRRARPDLRGRRVVGASRVWSCGVWCFLVIFEKRHTKRDDEWEGDVRRAAYLVLPCVMCARKAHFYFTRKREHGDGRNASAVSSWGQLLHTSDNRQAQERPPAPHTYT